MIPLSAMIAALSFGEAVEVCTWIGTQQSCGHVCVQGTSNYTLLLRFERHLNSAVAVIGVRMAGFERFLRPACRCGDI
jgi:hypothetical protein